MEHEEAAKHLADAAEGADGVNSGGQNVVFSPLSIYAALALLSAGARGTTLDEVRAVLGASSRDEIAEFVSAVVERALADHSESSAPLCQVRVRALAREDNGAEAGLQDSRRSILQGRDARR
ncbi:unnamed protein product [Miscanthus lutarioriparius]|uniref:Serpin domain-containing protein n=1 Tax=Miscanthus lutarioriparius TaxID=422564 RepID=A0A811R4H9_9POAL|nr:unnamed protein product [Miscanthus lutarioriparius]